MIEDILATIQATIDTQIAPPGLSPITPSIGATGTVAWDSAALAFGTYQGILTITTGGALGTARATLSLDNGLTTSPPFVLPVAIPPAGFGVYAVPLLDPINPGGNPSPVLSGLVLDFSGTFNDGATYSFEAIGQNTYLIGEENLSSQDYIFPRIIWVPTQDSFGGSEDYALGSTQRTSQRSLYTSVTGVEAHIWGADRRRTVILRQQVLNGIHFSALGVSQPHSGQWVRNKDQVSKAGRLYVLNFSVQEPILVFQPEFVQAPPPFGLTITPEIDSPI